jgi:exodeoxyribonuclease VII small subunit
MPNTEPTGVQISCENAIERLDQIVGEMDSTKLPMEELLTRYEEGLRLDGICNQQLAGAENRIETLSRSANGKEQSPSGATPQDSPKDSNKIKHEEIRLF